ncbi:MAG: hypothetical protein ACI4KB_04990 [Oscillospiraceae bacterium]
MNKKRIISAVMSLSMAFSVSAFTYADRVSATTVDDVIAYAYAVGLPEAQIQECINRYSGGSYTSEQCDQAIGMLAQWKADRDAAIGGGDTPSESGTESGSSSSASDSNADSGPESEKNTNTGADEPIPEDVREEFVNMDVHDKQEFVNSLPSEEKKGYLDLMTNEEKNQLLKELDPSQQVEIISGMLGFGEAFGYQLSVENVSDGAVMLSARDEDGKLVNVSVIGDSVEKTGKPYLVPIAVCAGLMLLSAAGMFMLVRKCR